MRSQRPQRSLLALDEGKPAGQPQPDGSWKYVEPNGCVHTMTAERAQAFMQQTHEHANIMCTMLDRLREAGLMDNIVDTEAQAA